MSATAGHGFSIKRSGIEHNRTLAYELCKRWTIEKGGDVSPLLELFHNDATIRTMADPRFLAAAADVKSVTTFGEGVKYATKNQPLRLELRGITADEDRVAVEFTSHAVVNGHTYDNLCHALLEIEGDKIQNARLYGDILLASKWAEWIKEGDSHE